MVPQNIWKLKQQIKELFTQKWKFAENVLTLMPSKK